VVDLGCQSRDERSRVLSVVLAVFGDQFKTRDPHGVVCQMLISL